RPPQLRGGFPGLALIEQLHAPQSVRALEVAANGRVVRPPPVRLCENTERLREAPVSSGARSHREVEPLLVRKTLEPGGRDPVGIVPASDELVDGCQTDIGQQTVWMRRQTALELPLGCGQVASLESLHTRAAVVFDHALRLRADRRGCRRGHRYEDRG